MDAAIVIALIALLGAVLSTLVTTFGAPVFQGRREARAVLNTYREPLLSAAFELQSRLRNILDGEFLEKYLASEEQGKQEAAAARGNPPGTGYRFVERRGRDLNPRGA